MDEVALEQFFVREAFRYFNQHAEWPTIERLHLLMVRGGLEDVSVGDVLTFFSRHSGTFHSAGLASLPLADFLNLSEAQPLAEEFVRVIGLLVEEFRTTADDDKPILTSAEIQDALSIDEREIRKLYQLLQGREGGVLTNGFTLHPDGAHWDCIVSPDVMLFKSITSLREYLARRDEKFPSLRVPSLSVGEPPPALESRPKAFLLMPFDSSLDWLREEIVAAGWDASVQVVRADDIFESGIVIDQIEERIAKADAVIAVCTGRNANVFYELGIAKRVHKPILVAETSSDLPFDVRHFRAQLYGGTSPNEGRATLKARLINALEETIPAERRKTHLRPSATEKMPSDGEAAAKPASATSSEWLKEQKGQRLRPLFQKAIEASALMWQSAYAARVVGGESKADDLLKQAYKTFAEVRAPLEMQRESAGVVAVWDRLVREYRLFITTRQINETMRLALRPDLPEHTKKLWVQLDVVRSLDEELKETVRQALAALD